MELSVVIALYNERESLRELVEGITAVAGKMGIEYDPARKYEGLNRKDILRPELPGVLRCC